MQQVEKKTFAEEVNNAFKEAANGPMKGVLGVSEEPLVSVDFRSVTHVLVTHVITCLLCHFGRLVRQASILAP